jgi:hypothetical protein
MSKIETNVVKPDLSFFENEKTNEILTSKDENNLDSKISDIENYMLNNSANASTKPGWQCQTFIQPSELFNRITRKNHQEQ